MRWKFQKKKIKEEKPQITSFREEEIREEYKESERSTKRVMGEYT